MKDAQERIVLLWENRKKMEIPHFKYPILSNPEKGHNAWKIVYYQKNLWSNKK
jgi:hypothetical protein